MMHNNLPDGDLAAHLQLLADITQQFGPVNHYLGIKHCGIDLRITFIQSDAGNQWLERGPIERSFKRQLNDRSGAVERHEAA